MRQRRQTPLVHLLGGEHRGLVDDFPDALAAHALATFVGEQRRRGSGVEAGFA